MGDSRKKNLYERYEPIRRRVEVGFWIVFMALQAVFNTVVALVDSRGRAVPRATWEIVTWEVSSHLVLLALVPAVVAVQRRLLPLARTHLLRFDWLQAEGNYVGLHVNGHDYLLRATLTDFLAQLDPVRFVRVHRSHAVNLGRIKEIEPLDGGDARLHMADGTTVPCSRRYREALRAGVGR